MDRPEGIQRTAGVLAVPNSADWFGEERDSGMSAMPPAPALLTTPDGTILEATEQLATLAGERSATVFRGRKIADLVRSVGALQHLRTKTRDIPVRTLSWLQDEGRHRVTLLVDLSAIVSSPGDNDKADARQELIDAQRMARVGSWVYEPDKDTFHRSKALKESFMLPGQADDVDVMIGSTFPADREIAQKFYDELMESNDDRVHEAELRNFDGSRIFQCTGRADRDKSGNITRLRGTVQDVTEHRLLERQLREERRKLNDAQRLARLGTWEWDPETNVTRLSDMLFEITGRRPGSDTTFQAYLDQVHPDDRGWVEEAWDRLKYHHEPVEVEHRYIRADGAVRVFRAQGTAIRDTDGRPLVLGSTQDVTEQRTALTRMERSSQRFTDLVAMTPVGIGLFDQSERLVDANDTLCDLLGYQLDQFRGMTAGQMAHPSDGEDGIGLREAAEEEASGRRRVPQRLLIRSDGEPVYCELHVAMSVQDDGTRFWLVVFQDVTERRRAAEALRYQATHDDLTGLPNRTAVKELLGHLLGRPDSDRVAVLFCDIDNFKRVNDSLGHDAGDELLVALARRLEGGLPDGCTAARLSGDEFVIICQDIDSVGGVDSLATKVASLLRTAVPVHGQLVRVSASIGAAVPSGGAGGEDLLRFADAAMFEAKRRGAGRVSLASPALMASADRQLHLEGQLREALNNDGLTLCYQPVVRSDGTVASAEALVRWPHPDRGLLSPDAFLPIAEQGDLLRELDRWVLRTALKEAASWTDPNGQKADIAVNLGGLVPGDREFVEVVADTVAECDIDWSRVVLELVETALVDLPSRSRQAMAELVDRGIRFAVDDFGTGYSSLARLKDLPAQIIKVDRRFVAGVGGDASDFAVARAVVDMARAMGRHCVAEGVETATQFHVLSGVGVDFYQGWLFSRPVPAKEFRELLAAGPLHVPRSS